MSGFANQWWGFLAAKTGWEDELFDLMPEGADFDKIGTDDYDASLEIRGASDNLRLPCGAQEFVRAAGFSKIYVYHQDGWETHYGLSGDLPARGWRRRYVSDPAAATTNVLAGPANPGYSEISYWPLGWDSPGCAEWLSTGYMRIVPDALDPLADDAA